MRRYDTFVQVGIPLSIRTDKLRSASGSQLAVVLYSLLGGDTTEISELSLEDIPTICSGIRRIMSPGTRRWYASEAIEKVNLLGYYESHGFGYKRFTTTIDEMNRQLAELHGGARDAPSLDRSQLDGGLLDLPTAGVLVHGDMHLGNIITYGDAALFGIIDYRNVGIGPRLIDFLTLEIDCWLRSPTPEVSRRELYDAFVRGWELADVASSRLPTTRTLEHLDDELADVADIVAQAPDWMQPRLGAVLTCRRAQTANLSAIDERERVTQMWTASIRRWSFTSAWSSGDERRALRTAPLAIAVGCDERLRALAAEQGE